jgi:hypothetical protein
MKNKKYHTVETTPKSSTHIHDCSISLLSTCASINSFRAKLLLCAQPAHLSETMRSYKYFQLGSKILTLTYTGRTAILWKKNTKKPIILNIIQHIFLNKNVDIYFGGGGRLVAFLFESSHRVCLIELLLYDNFCAMRIKYIVYKIF